MEREWVAMSEVYIQKVCGAFWPHLEAMDDGGHFEK